MNQRKTKKAWKLYFDKSRKLRSGMQNIVNHGMTAWITIKEEEVIKRYRGYNSSVKH